MRKISLILGLVFLGLIKSYSQNFTKNSLFGGIGVGYSVNSQAGGGELTGQLDISETSEKVDGELSLVLVLERIPRK